MATSRLCHVTKLSSSLVQHQQRKLLPHTTRSLFAAFCLSWNKIYPIPEKAFFSLPFQELECRVRETLFEHATYLLWLRWNKFSTHREKQYLRAMWTISCSDDPIWLWKWLNAKHTGAYVFIFLPVWHTAWGLKAPTDLGKQAVPFWTTKMSSTLSWRRGRTRRRARLSIVWTMTSNRRRTRSRRQRTSCRASRRALLTCWTWTTSWRAGSTTCRTSCAPRSTRSNPATWVRAVRSAFRSDSSRSHEYWNCPFISANSAQVRAYQWSHPFKVKCLATHLLMRLPLSVYGSAQKFMFQVQARTYVSNLFSTVDARCGVSHVCGFVNRL